MAPRPPSPPAPSSPELRCFNIEIEFLLKPKNPRARSLYSFIKRTLWQFHLDGIYTEIDIFNQAYLRGVSLTQSGTAINSPKAWIRTTAFNIIRELSRTHQREQTVEYNELAEFDQAKLKIALMQESNSLVSDEVIEADLQAVLLSLKELNPKECRIIQLRTIQNLSWKEVAQHLVELGEEVQSEVALRKQGQRVMERLRQLYHQNRSLV